MRSGPQGEGDADPEPDPLCRAIRALIQGFEGRQRTRKVLIEALIANGLSQELARPVDAAMRDILKAHEPAGEEGETPLSPVTAYVLTRAIVGTLRAALMEQSAFLGTPEFEDELVRLARGLLDPKGPTPSGA
ncbi:hypothetical protein [Breoghania sp.]|uniref:hypothetical protein n=1 Tax=Breoghania sp. TaxID=2065378 RepID=UPI0026088F4D|nr:hypothetical protein [Breoghania sp.]MDJ0930166.1 hypothetical protein [Breoghania sp.]